MNNKKGLQELLALLLLVARGFERNVVVGIDKGAQQLELPARHNDGLDGLGVEKQNVAGQVDGGDVAHIDEVAAAHAEEGGGDAGHGIAGGDGFFEDGKRGKMGAHLSIAEIEIGVVAIGLKINYFVEIDYFDAVP